jgi:hypothetical protein
MHQSCICCQAGAIARPAVRMCVCQLYVHLLTGTNQPAISRRAYVSKDITQGVVRYVYMLLDFVCK